MVCMDGFVLTHAMEAIDVPDAGRGRRLAAAVPAAAAPRPGRPGHDRRDGRARGVHRGQVPRCPRQLRGPRRGARARGRFAEQSGATRRAASRVPHARTPTRRRRGLGSVLGTLADVVDELRDEGVRSAPSASPASALSLRRGRARRSRVPPRGRPRPRSSPSAPAASLGQESAPPRRRRAAGPRRRRRPRRAAVTRRSAASSTTRAGESTLATHLPRPRVDSSSGSSRGSAERGRGPTPRTSCATSGVAAEPAPRRMSPRQDRSSSTRVGTFAAGNRLLRTPSAPSRRGWSARTRSPRPSACQGCGEALGARVRARRRDARDRAAGWSRSMRPGASRCSRRPTPSRPGGCRGSTRCSATPPRWRPGSPPRCAAQGRDDVRVVGPGGRRRHRRHRPRVPIRDVRAQRRRAVRLLRQPGLHEHRRPALRGDAGGRQHRDHPADRRRGRQRVRHRQEPPAHRHGSPDPVRGHGHGGGPARSRAQGRRAMRAARIALPACPRAVPTRLGIPARDTILLARLAKETGLFPVFEAEDGEITSVSRFADRSGRGLPASRRPASPISSARRPRPTSWPD